MKTHRQRFFSVSAFLSVGAACALTGCGFFAPTPASAPARETRRPTPAVASAAPEASSASVSSARSRFLEPEDNTPVVVKLAAHDLPLTIEMPPTSDDVEAWTLDKTGGAEVGNAFYGYDVHVFKPGPDLKTLAAAKITRKKMAGCLSYPLVKEEADYLVFDCKMRSMHTHQFLMLKEIGGVTYACESQAHADTVAALDKSLAVCRTLKAE